MNRRAHWLFASLTAGLTLAAQTARAHLVTTGLGPVYDGMSHFAFSPEEVLPVLALALFAGLRGPAPARRVFFVLPSAWILGGLCTGSAPPLTDFSTQVITAALLLLVGGMLVAEAFRISGIPRAVRIPETAAVLIAALLGLVRGDIDMAGFAGRDSGVIVPGVLAFFGVVTTVSVLTALAASLSLPLKAVWLRIGVCVTGSWSAALGLLLAGWSIHLAMASPH
jgi:urease accessory protein